MDWAGLGVLAGVSVGALGYLARQLDHRIGDLREDMREEFAEVRTELRTLSDAYIRHLEQHVAR